MKTNTGQKLYCEICKKETWHIYNYDAWDFDEFYLCEECGRHIIQDWEIKSQ